MKTKIHTVGVHYCDVPNIPKKLLERKDLAWWAYYPDEVSTDVLWSEFNNTSGLTRHPASFTGNQQWPGVWATHTVNQMRYSITPNSTPTKHFCVLNRKPRPHRIDIMNRLYHSGTLEHSHYSWIASHEDQWGSNQVCDVPVVYLDGDIADESNMWSPPAVAFADSAISVVLESNDDVLFVTEKTFIPLYQQRMPLVYAAPKFYKLLLAWGFEFPREICFDFDCDAEPDLRRSCFVAELQRLVAVYTPAQLHQMYAPYAARNKQTLLAIAADIPDSYWEWKKTVPVKWAESARHFIQQIEQPPWINTL